MINVGIVEDDMSWIRYGDIGKNHNVFAYFIEDTGSFLDKGYLDIFKEGTGCDAEVLIKSQFGDSKNLEKGVKHFKDIIVPERDIWFVDGLRGSWKDVVKWLPKEKVYVCSDSSKYMHEAREMGYNTIDDSQIEKVADNFGKQLGLSYTIPGSR